MGYRTTIAHSTYYKRLLDGNFEYGFLKGWKQTECKVGVTDNPIKAFWWCQLN